MIDYTVLGLAGRIGSGKSTLADALVERGWTKMSYADGVRELALKLDPIVVPECEGVCEETLRLSYVTSGGDWTFAKTIPEVRRILQVVGTEIGRSIDPDIWVNKLAQRMYKLPAGTKVVIDDVRFPNEADRIRHLWGGKVVLLEGGKSESAHPSESYFDRLDVSATLPWAPLEERLWSLWKVVEGFKVP